MSNILVGSDPEVFLFNKRTKKVVSAIGIIPGSKNSPHKTAHGSIQPDNISAEFNSRPSGSADEFVKNHHLIMGDLRQSLPEDVDLLIKPSVIAEKSLLEHRDARRAGCEPDLDAWRMRLNNPPRLVGGLRACGGHLHISLDIEDDDIDTRVDMIRALDLTLGIQSVILDKDKRRRTLYGKAGATRFKFSHEGYTGVEYRTLSNFWLKKDSLMRWAFNNVVKTYESLPVLKSFIEDNGEEIVRIINEGDSLKAKNFINKNKQLLGEFLYETIA